MNDDFKPSKAVKSVPDTNNLQDSFQTPDQVAAKNKPGRPMRLLAAPKKLHWWLKSLSRQERFLALMCALAILGGAGFAASKIWFSDNEPPSESQAVKKAPEPAPLSATVPSRMTGVQVARELNDLPVTAVMIENSPDARPQSGLTQADTVFEAIAEGGITRFLVLYQESQPDYIGPVRSVRPYYLDFLGPFDAAVAHAGGSAPALALVKSQGVKDLDQFANPGAYQRVSSRYAPHNLYTSRAKLLDLQKQKGFTSSTYTGIARKDAATPAATPTAKTLDFTISGPLYNPHFDYDISTHSYKRVLAGKPHVDEKSGNQIAPQVVVGLIMSHHYDGVYSVYGTLGTGKAIIFQDGISIEANWEKPDRKSQYVLKDNSGNVLKLNPGQTWYVVVTGSDKIKFAP